MLEAFESELKAGQNVLIPHGDLARSWLPEQLRERGLHVTEAIIYDTILAGEDDDELLKLLEEGGIHAVTFTSSSTVKNFMKMLKRMGVEDPLPLLKSRGSVYWSGYRRDCRSCRIKGYSYGEGSHND